MAHKINPQPGAEVSQRFQKYPVREHFTHFHIKNSQKIPIGKIFLASSQMACNITEREHKL